MPNMLLTYIGSHRRDDRFKNTMLPLMASYFQFDPELLDTKIRIYPVPVMNELNIDFSNSSSEYKSVLLFTERKTQNPYSRQ